jgi:hypothetical protein
MICFFGGVLLSLFVELAMRAAGGQRVPEFYGF